MTQGKQSVNKITKRLCTGLGAALLLLASFSFAKANDNETFTLGVQTHFSQGWPLSLYSKLPALHQPPIRDSIPWVQFETKESLYQPIPQVEAFMARQKRYNVPLLLTFSHRHPSYGGERFPKTQQERDALANYIVEVLKSYGGQVRAIEIGNEINGNVRQWASSRADLPKVYIDILKTIYAKVKAYDPSIKVIGGAAHSVPLGLFDDLFKLDALAHMDGIAIHPYRNTPEHLEIEIENLRLLMKRYGKEVSIYATEFGKEFDNVAEAPAYLAKMVAIMSSSRVKEAYWYALIQQSYFKNMGLMSRSGAALPAFKAFRFLNGLLKEHGSFVRIGSDPLLRMYQTKSGKVTMIWGSERVIEIPAGSSVFKPDGTPLESANLVGSEPLVIVGDAPTSIGQSDVLADAFLQYGQAPWSYSVLYSDGRTFPLERMDWDWTSYLGHKWANPSRINADRILVSAPKENPLSLIETFTAPEAMKVSIAGEWAVIPETSDGITVDILLNGSPISQQFSGRFVEYDGTYALKEGDQLSFQVGPGATSKDDILKRQIQIKRLEE